MSGRLVVGLMLRASLVAALGMLMAAHAKAREMVPLRTDYPAGVIIIKQSEKKLYLTVGPGMAIRYPIAIGKAGKAWSGVARVDGKYVQPAWSPPAVVKRDNPRLPAVIPGGSPGNPMGARALTLDREEIAIHGTTQAMRASVGTAASYGCIRMYNEDVIDLFERVAVGTPVVAIR
jgi:lipoprotein-anchoring transpeptidase ErfK/SrfK